MAFIVSIAGSDSSCGAGIQADILCINALGHHALSVVTAVTAQDQNGVNHIAYSDEATLQTQLKSAFSAFKVCVIKSGMLPTHVCVRTLATILQAQTNKYPFILDPVMCASNNSRLIQQDAGHAMVQHLFPLATLVTPNISEAEILTDRSINSLEDIVAAGKQILTLGCSAVLIKGGHTRQNPGMDVLLNSHKPNLPHYIRGEYFADRSPRGTGCTYASAIAGGLASDLSLYEAILNAKRYITSAIKNAYQIEPNYWLLNHRVAASEI